MKPLRSYQKATIYFREGGQEDIYKVEVYQSLVIYLDKNGNEYALSWYYVKQVVNYVEDGREVNYGLSKTD